jgi:hypothetical protein
MAKRLSEAVVRERLREFYEPHTGEGLGAREFGWSSLIAELVEPDPSAASSYSARRLPLRPSPRCAERRRAPRGR